MKFKEIGVFFQYKSFIICSKRISRKKAGISFGFPFDDQNNANKKYADLKQLLKSIAKKSNMVSKKKTLIEITNASPQDSLQIHVFFIV